MKSNFIENGYISAVKKIENTFVDTHFHDFFELEYIISGSGAYTVDGKTYNIQPGDLFFLTPFNFHCVDIKSTQLFNVMFSGNICDGALLLNLAKNAPIVLNLSEQSKTFFETILDELCSNIENKEYAITLLNTVAVKLEQEILKDKRSSNLSTISKSELFILTNFRNEITLTEVANEVALAPSYFSKLFKKEKGVGYKAYLNNMRYEYAKKLLEHSEMTVMQICTDCGFNDYPNFIRRFKQQTGCYPAQYRILLRNKAGKS